MIGNHKDTNKYPINLLIINYLYNFFRPYNYFLSIFKQLLITNPSACVEIYDLVIWGLVKPEDGWVIENNSAPVHVNNISITEFGLLFSSALLTEKISEEDKTKVIQSLKLQEKEGTERINRTHALEWKDWNDGVIRETVANEVEKQAKEREYKETDQAMFDFDAIRGK